MTIFSNNLKRMSKSKVRLIIMFIIPILFIAAFVMTPEDKAPLNLAIIDEDNTILTEIIYNQLESNFSTVEVEKNNITSSLITMDIDYAIVINKGFTDEIINGEDPVIEGYSIQGVNSSLPVKSYTDSILNSVKKIAFEAEGNEDIFFTMLESFKNGPLTLKVEANNETTNKIRSEAAIGFLVQFMLYMSVITTSFMLLDKENRTFYRVFSTPISMKRYMFENLLSFSVVALLQVGSGLIVMKYFMGINLGHSFLNMFILLAIFSLVCITLGLVITSYAKTSKLAYLIIFFLTTPLVMLGGCYWPLEYMSDIFIKISNLLPTTWLMKGAHELIYGGNLHDIYDKILILIAFSVVFFLIGTIRKVDVTN